MKVDRVFVVTIYENRGSVTRCVFAQGTAHDFLSWVVSKGMVATLRIMDGEFPDRSAAEMLRAGEYAQMFVQETM